MDRSGKGRWYPARSETPSRHGNNLRENREILQLPKPGAWVASRSLRTHGDDEREQEVGQLHCTGEVCEQTDALGQRGADGGKAAGQGE